MSNKFIVDPITSMCCSISSDYLRVAIELVVGHLTFLDTSIWPDVDTVSVIFSIFPLTAESNLVLL